MKSGTQGLRTLLRASLNILKTYRASRDLATVSIPTSTRGLHQHLHSMNVSVFDVNVE